MALSFDTALDAVEMLYSLKLAVDTLVGYPGGWNPYGQDILSNAVLEVHT